MNFKKMTDSYKNRHETYIKSIESMCVSEKANKEIGITPNYVEEVIIPIFQCLAQKMPHKNIIIPDAKTYYSIKGYYRIKIGITTVGGISVPESDDFSIYFTPMWHAQPVGEKKLVHGIGDLTQLIINQLKKEEKNP